MFAGRFRRGKKVVEGSPRKKTTDLLARMRKGEFPAAAVAGAFASFADAAFGAQPASKDTRPADATNPSQAESPVPQEALELAFVQSSSLPLRLRQSLSGIAISANDRVFLLGDGLVHIFERDGTFVRSWKAPDNATCVAVDTNETVYFGVAGRVEVFSSAGIHKTGFEAGPSDRPAVITAIKAGPKEIFVADAAARYIVRFDRNGKRIGEIGSNNKTGGFMLPNRFLDIDVDRNGMVAATDTGRHRVSLWNLDGTSVRSFGKFGLWHEEDFVGCCNPVNLALAPGGRIVTAEKVVPRVKIYNSTGKLLGRISPEHFDSKCIHLHLAVDSIGRIFVADPVRLDVKVFSARGKSGGSAGV